MAGLQGVSIVWDVQHSSVQPFLSCGACPLTWGGAACKQVQIISRNCKP